MVGPVIRGAIKTGWIVGRRVVMIAEPGEREAAGQAELLQCGIEEITRLELVSLDGGLGDEDRSLVSKAMALARISGAEEIGVLINWRREAALDEICAILDMSPLTVRLYPDLKTRAILDKNRSERFDPYLSVEVQRAPLSWSERTLKRGFDIVTSACALLLLSPLLAATSALIKLDTPGPIIFRQRRTGSNRRVFTILKFRTMTVLEDGAEIAQATKRDKRVTRIGALLRQTSIDELPQLWNVLRGDMSLVGPRPHAVAHDLEFAKKINAYPRRHHVKPGLTGAAQVRGHRGQTQTLGQMEARVEWDLWYINNWSLLLDIRILFSTFAALVKHESF